MGNRLGDRDIGYDFPHWRYYLNLEEDLSRCFRYVEPAENQNGVFSEEFAKLILAACTEFENSLKNISRSLGKGNRGNINFLLRNLESIFPNFSQMKFSMPQYSISLQPLESYGTADGIDWWKNGYNNIKHDRSGSPDCATLIRACNSLAALQLPLLHFYKIRYNDPVLPIGLAPALIVPVELETKSYWDTGFISWEWHPLYGDLNR